MIIYHVKLCERELELVLMALGLLAEEAAGGGHADDAREARDLLVRLDQEGDAQFAENQREA